MPLRNLLAGCTAALALALPATVPAQSQPIRIGAFLAVTGRKPVAVFQHFAELGGEADGRRWCCRCAAATRRARA